MSHLLHHAKSHVRPSISHVRNYRTMKALKTMGCSDAGLDPVDATHIHMWFLESTCHHRRAENHRRLYGKRCTVRCSRRRYSPHHHHHHTTTHKAGARSIISRQVSALPIDLLLLLQVTAHQTAHHARRSTASLHHPPPQIAVTQTLSPAETIARMSHPASCVRYT